MSHHNHIANKQSGIPYMIGFLLVLPFIGGTLTLLTPFFRSHGLIP